MLRTMQRLLRLVLDGVYRRTEGEPVFQQARAPTGDELAGLLDKIIARLLTMLTRQGYLVEEEGVRYMADRDADNSLASLQACAPMRTASACMPGCAVTRISAGNSNGCAGTSRVPQSPTSGSAAMARVTSCCN